VNNNSIYLKEDEITEEMFTELSNGKEEGEE